MSTARRYGRAPRNGGRVGTIPPAGAATSHTAGATVDAPGARVIPRAALLSNGRWTTLLTARGTGVSRLDGETLTRWVDDPVEDDLGAFLYLRDRESGRLWSAGLAPTEEPPQRYAAEWRQGVFTIARVDDGVETRLDTWVAADAAAEIRQLTLRNLGTAPRTIEVTTYAEVVLHDARADAAHPAFSKLFVQTEYDDRTGLLLARRRPRQAGERHPWLVHALHGAGPLEHETDRARFLGRGHTRARPRALVENAPLSGTTGDVLDPILSLRRTVRVAPDAAVELIWVLAADDDRDRARDLALRFADRAGLERERERAARLDGESETARVVDEATTRPVLDGHVQCRPVPMPSSSDDHSHDTEALLHWNGYGGFAPNGREYVVRLGATPGGGLRRPPLPWVNVLANPDFGALVSETGAGCTWSRNSREHRLTPWSNDPVLDPHGEAIYLKDEASGAWWSVAPGPAPAPVGYEARHGFGTTRWRHRHEGLRVDAIAFVPPDDAVKITRVRIANESGRARRLSLLAYYRLVLGVTPEEDGRFVVTDEHDGPDILYARNSRAGDFADGIAFGALLGPDPSVASFTCDRTSFLGLHRGPASPAGMGGERLDGRAGGDLDPCFAQKRTLEVAAGAAVEVVVLLGEARSVAAARSLVARYGTAPAAEEALRRLEAFWSERLDGIRVRTPSAAIDLMVNGWLAYQTLVCRIWGRTAFYQSGGAFGFRDQLQDAAAFASLRPEITRAQILLHAAHQFVEGDVLHWWHPPSGRGIRTRFADDLLWLPFVLARYIETTGDRSVLEERVGFLTARPLQEGEDEAYLLPEDSGERADVYEHACRAIDRSLLTGRHGLPLFGTGDWNDGMNRVGRGGRGESVWMAFFLHAVLGDMLPLCEQRQDTARIGRYARHRERLARAVNEGGWDGAWYRRGYFDDGAPLGSAASDECRIDALAQAWAVLSGAAPWARAEQAMDAVEQHLISEVDGIIRLLAPPFERTAHDPGYIKGYPPGVRENGGQYTHAALWVVQAMAELGRRDRAARLLEMLSPVHHASTPEQVERYQVEPYVVAADVYGVAPHVGRGGWTWYTGSAGWMLRVAVESVLGLRVENGDTLRLRPCVPAEWTEFSIDYRLPGEETRYEIRMTGSAQGKGRVVEARIDGVGAAIEDGAARIPIRHDGAVHRVDAVLG